jgi:hypothetical protein
VTGLEAGRRVAWYLNYGRCAELVALPASALIPVPEEIEDEVAAAEGRPPGNRRAGHDGQGPAARTAGLSV